MLPKASKRLSKILALKILSKMTIFEKSGVTGGVLLLFWQPDLFFFVNFGKNKLVGRH